MISQVEKEEREGKFFYAVILADGGKELEVTGLEGQKVYTISYKDIAAVVSDYPRVDSIKLLRKNLLPYHFYISLL